MSYAKPLSMRVDAAAGRRHPARISLTSEQRYLIAAAYEKAAADVSLPGHTRLRTLADAIAENAVTLI